VCDDVRKERDQQAMALSDSKLIVCYSDIVKESFFGSSKSSVMNVYNYNGERTFSIRDNNPHYVDVDRTAIKDISIILANEKGEQLNVASSSTPTFLCLKFKKF